MLSYLDPILFPDACEVLEVSPGRYVYPIFKNGSSSLHANDFRRLDIDEIKQVTNIEIFVREPLDRFVSGVSTFLSHNPKLDRFTTLHFVDQYLFLNRHFCPQFFWILNLQRFTNANLTILPLSRLSSATPNRRNQKEFNEELYNFYKDHSKLNFYLELDKCLMNFFGRTVSFDEILNHLKTSKPEVYAEIIQRAKNLCTVLD